MSFTGFSFYIAVVRCGFDKHLYLSSCLNAHNHNTRIHLPQTGCAARKLAFLTLLIKIGMESKEQKVSIGKTEVMVSSRRGTKVNIKDSQGTSLRQVNKFRGSEEAVRARVSAAWGKWRRIRSYQ